MDGASTFPAYASIGFAQGAWGRFVKAFGAAADADTSRPEVAAQRPDTLVLEAGNSITVTGRVASMDDLDEAYFVFGAKTEDGVVAAGLLPEDPAEDGALSHVFDGSWFALEAGDHRVLAAVTGLEDADDEGASFLAEVPAQVREQGQTDVVDVTLTFLVTKQGETLVGEFVQAVAFEDEGPREVPLGAGDTIIPVYVRIDDDGTLEPVPATDESAFLTLARDSDVRIGSVRVPAGEWLVGFLATDLADNSSFGGVPVTVK